MLTTITIKDGFTFNETHLKTHNKLIEKKAHPYVYDCDIPKVTYIDTILIDIKDVIFDSVNRIQKPRLVNNVKQPAIKKDIEDFGFSLSNTPILVEKLSNGKYELLDGRTRFDILKGLGVTNIIAGTFEPMSTSDRLLFGVKMNNINKPFGEASFPDIKNALLNLVESGKIDGKTRTEIVESTQKYLNAMSHKLLPQQISLAINEVVDKKTGSAEEVKSFPEGKGADDALTQMGIVDTPFIKNFTVSTYIEKTLSAIIRKVEDPKNKDAIELHFFAHGSVLDANDPATAWLKGPKKLKDNLDNWVARLCKAYLRIDITKEHFKDYQSKYSVEDGPVAKVIGAIPMVKSLEKPLMGSSQEPIPMDKIYKFK